MLERKRITARKVRVGAVSVLVVGALVAGAYAVGATAATNRAVNAIVGAGIMTKYNNGFRPNDPATRSVVALALHRSIPRIAVQESLGDMSSLGVDETLGSVTMKIDGAPGKNQGVLVTVQMQLDHDNPVASGCFPSWTLTKGADPTVLGFWDQEIYAGAADGEEDNIVFSMFVSQPTNSSAAYHLLGSNPCDQTLFTDEDTMYAQNFPLTGKGKVVPAAAVFQHHSAIRHHDQ